MSAAQPVKRLGDLLVQRQLISQAQLDQALKQQQATREFLGAILVKMKALSQEQLLTTLSHQLGIPYQASLQPEEVNWAVVRQFPTSVLSTGSWFPIQGDAVSVTVAIANPLDAWAISAIEKAAGFRKVRTVLVPEPHLQAVLRTYRAQTLKSLDAHFGSDDR